VTIERSRRRVSSARLARVARELLDAADLCAIATVSPRGQLHVNTAYFALAPDLRLVWISDPAATHSRNLRANGEAAVVVYDSAQSWGGTDRGIQVFGSGHAAADDAAEIYARRFPNYRADELAAYRCYELRPRRVKLFDERTFGAGVFVTARVGGRGALEWVRTEIYS
jgi:uncharacterized protein YhbP (UPF0306 family)